jgi:hypothetical protein
MAEPTTAPEIKTMTAQQAQAYKDACDNLIYLKREQFQVTYYTWLVLAALFILSKQVPQQPKLILMGGVVICGLLSVGTLLSFKKSITRFRKRLNFIYQTYFDERERTELGLEADEPHSDVVSILMATCALAAVFTFALMLK